MYLLFFLCLSDCMPVFVSPSAHLSISINLSVYLSVCLSDSINLSVYLSVCLSVTLSLPPTYLPPSHCLYTFYPVLLGLTIPFRLICSTSLHHLIIHTGTSSPKGKVSTCQAWRGCAATLLAMSTWWSAACGACWLCPRAARASLTY